MSIIAPFKAVTTVYATALKYDCSRLWCTFNWLGGSQHLGNYSVSCSVFRQGSQGSLFSPDDGYSTSSTWARSSKTSLCMSTGAVGTPLGFWADLHGLLWLCTAPPALHWSWGVLRSYPQLSSVFLKRLWCSLSRPTSGLNRSPEYSQESRVCLGGSWSRLQLLRPSVLDWWVWEFVALILWWIC